MDGKKQTIIFPLINSISAAMDRRLSTNSESSIEPNDSNISNSNSIDVTSKSITVAAKRRDRNESEEAFESDERAETDERDEADGDADVDEDDDNANSEQDEANKHGHIVRRENLRQLENNVMSMRKKLRYSSNSERMPNNNNNNKSNSKVSQRIEARESNDSNGNVKSAQYSCPICGVCSPTQHEFTEHIRGHNNADGSHNYTCQICFKVNFNVTTFVVRTFDQFVFLFTRLYRRRHRWIAMYLSTLVSAHLIANIAM